MYNRLTFLNDLKNKIESEKKRKFFRVRPLYMWKKTLKNESAVMAEMQKIQTQVTSRHV